MSVQGRRHAEGTVALTAEKTTKVTKETNSAQKAVSAEEAEGAFEVAFREQWPRVVATLYRLVGESDEAEDLALETFWRLHQSSPSLTHQESLRGWLYRVATNLGLNALRARKRRQLYEAQANQRDLLESQPEDPAEKVERVQDGSRVRLTLAQMKPQSAQLLLLRYSGFSYTEIATTLGFAPASVGTLLARAEKEFEERYRLREEGEG